MHYDRVTAPDHGRDEVSEHGIPRTLGGWPLRALMAIASLLMPLFFVTGVWLWLARRNADRRREVRRRWNALANENGSQ
mgnify:CR=1 FL=1